MWITAALVAVIGVGAVTVWMLRPGESAASAPVISPTPTATATPTPTPSPTATGYPANESAYDLGTLPQVNVFAVIPALPVDTDPYGAFTGEDATARAAGAPVFADPLGQPVAYLPADYTYGGTTVPIIERQANWVHVLLAGRQAVPSQGDPAQITGWLRAQDVVVAPLDASVEVNISARTIDIVRAGIPQRIATDFGWGADATPTPHGRAFIMTTRVEQSFLYTRGYPLVYLSTQSPTMDGFAGADVAVTAFHYHDERSGNVSNGCLRVDPDTITQLAALPLGTPVTIHP
ncbi:L,D-transpeptidase [Microbacterium rhizomatis]|uniref:L,D-transpeptidase n=1 Tax=Microbacterium rhizomatis TaxID=1631477 RepID=A0A5J5JA44_9MICO|nr:L,D-transpeptidase [Microbacterium rhizomatis]